MTVYATRDADDALIAERAVIRAFDSEAEARTYLLAGLDRVTAAAIEPGRFADCWVRRSAAPDLGDGSFGPFGAEDLIVREPGTHPGGRAWWVEPTEPVLVLTGVREA